MAERKMTREHLRRYFDATSNAKLRRVLHARRTWKMLRQAVYGELVRRGSR